MYNYAKIEAYVDEEDLKKTVTQMAYILNSVDFPHPFGPIKAILSPVVASKSNPSKTFLKPKLLLALFTLTSIKVITSFFLK